MIGKLPFELFQAANVLRHNAQGWHMAGWSEEATEVESTCERMIDDAQQCQKLDLNILRPVWWLG
jgi:hypothetical protein